MNRIDAIAQSPDGEWIALRIGGIWVYRYIGSAQDAEAGQRANAADSWPVIYSLAAAEKLRAEIERLDRAEDQALRERDDLQETIDRILYSCSTVEQIGEWSSMNDPAERFIELFGRVDRIATGAPQ
ncbi:Uncharacterised protein [Mycobacteroides abscessus subsp. abscessus]|uniref:hypothetical protein n=1 Tax=Mycobacteroides abscessus TaxID=36809 RepID=UPI00092A1EB6|nr:hypothetical protein [Mycobacteroides abscessus]SIH37531.1 Uncharacterised protein [Mycobacteroides abscessus subsp. abscessus]